MINEQRAPTYNGCQSIGFTNAISIFYDNKDI